MKTKQYYVICKEVVYKDSMNNDLPWTSYRYHNTLPNSIEENHWNSTTDLGYAEVFTTKKSAREIAEMRENFRVITLAEAIKNEIKKELVMHEYSFENGRVLDNDS